MSDTLRTLRRPNLPHVSTFSDLLQARTTLEPHDVDHLHRLVAEWQLVSDLSFADLVLWVLTPDGGWLAVAHMRPTTGPTTYPEDVIGTVHQPAEADRIERAYREGRIVRAGDREWRGKVPCRQEAVPVRRDGAIVAVLSRDTNLAAARMPSQLELAYLTCAGELLQMVAEGAFPFPGSVPDPEHAPRVGDGFLRLDRTGHVVYASPNALSAHRRLGVTGDLLGAHLGQTIGRLTADRGQLDEPRGSAALAAVLRFQEPRESEMEAKGTTVLLRALPLVPGGEPRGALVLVRDVTEVRRRDRQIMGKDATIREIHHRVKNNLQTVAALLRLQSRRMTDPAARAALEESVRRVASIAVVHETLSQSLDELVDFDGIADKVLAMCAEVAAPESSVLVVRTGDFGVLDADIATPLATILTELVQNAVEHADASQVEVRVLRTPDTCTVWVEDDGRGLPAGFDLATSTTLGLQIVQALVAGQLAGKLTLEQRSTGGTSACLWVPLD